MKYLTKQIENAYEYGKMLELKIKIESYLSGDNPFLNKGGMLDDVYEELLAEIERYNGE